MSDLITADSTKEEIANYFQKNFKISEENKNNLIKEDISGDILLDITDKEFKSLLGITLGPLMKIKNFLKKEKEKFSLVKEIKEKITIKSSVKEVESFLKRCLNFSGNSDKLDGKKLIELNEEEMTKYGFNLGQKKKLLNYIKYFKTLPVEEENDSENEDIIINQNSSNEEVSIFLRKKSGLSQEIIDNLKLDAESLLLLEEDDIDDYEGLNDEEKNNLKNALKENKQKLKNINEKNTNENENKIEPEIKITKKSTEEETSNFLHKKLNLSLESINKLELDGASLFLLEFEDIEDYSDITQKEKEALKEFLYEIGKKPEQAKELKITYESSKDEINDFLVEKIKIKKELVDKLSLDGETLLLLNEKDINELEELSKKQKEELIKILKENIVRITERSNSSEVLKFLELNLDFEDKSIQTMKKLNLTGKKLLCLNDEDINKIKSISEKDRIKLKKYIHLMNITINRKSDKLEVAKFLKIKLCFSFKSIKKLAMNGEKLFSLNEVDIDKIQIITNEEKIRLKTFLIKPNYNIKNIKENYGCNIFFLLSIKDENKDNLRITFFENNKKIDNNIIYMNEYITKKNKLNINIFQAFANQRINNLSIKIKDEYNNLFFDSDNMKIKYEEINFYLDNLKFQGIKNNLYFIEIPPSIIMKEFLFCFFETHIKNKKFQIKLLKALVSKIKSSKSIIEIHPNEILKLFKLCYNYGIPIVKIDKLEMQFKNEELNKRYYISDDDLIKNQIEKKSKILYLLIVIFINYDFNYLLKLMDSKVGLDFSRAILDLLNEGKIKKDQIVFNNDSELIKFQQKLLPKFEKKEELNLIIHLSKGLYNNLIFIKDNIKQIYDIFEKNKKFYEFFSDYKLTLDIPSIDEDIDNIYSALKEIIGYQENKNKILDCNIIFENMLTTFSNKELNDFLKLNKILNLMEKEGIYQMNKEKFYKLIHKKGMDMIRDKCFNSEEIKKFLLEQDIYYYSNKFLTAKERDPEIFRFIIITDEDNNYLENINMIKKNEFWNLFSGVRESQNKFYRIILDQMKKLLDFKSLFDIFPLDKIDRYFIELINEKFVDILYKDNRELNETIYIIFDNWLTINYNDLNNYAITILNLKKNISKYYFHLLKSEKMEIIRDQVKHSIIRYFVDNKEGIDNAESLIELLLISNENDKIYFLDQLNDQIMGEKDFYSKEETKNFKLFKLFFEKHHLIFQNINNNINEGKYNIESINIKNKIYDDLKNNNVSYDLINNLLSEKNDIFYQKILVITNNQAAESIQILNKFKQNLKICNSKFKELKIIEDFYTTFYSKTKEIIINLIKEKILELKKTNISEIVIMNKMVFNDFPFFDYEQAKEESNNIKYKSSCFFMSIYNEIKNLKKEIITEDDIFKNSVNDFKETLTRIINQKDSKENFFEIKNIEKIMEVVRVPSNNLNKEINFILDEFANIGKNDYIKNELLNDLINYSKKDKIKNILRGILDLIEAYKDISNIQLTKFMSLSKLMYKHINSENVNGEDIKKAKKFLLQNGYDIERESSLLDIYELFGDKKNSIIFLKTIWDNNFDVRYLIEFIDESDSSDLQTSDIDNLVYINIFFSNLIKNEEIKTDENFLVSFKKEFENQKNISIKFNEYLKAYNNIIQLYNSYLKNPEMTAEKIKNILENSTVNLTIDELKNYFNFSIEYEKQGNVKVELKEINELRNKILLSNSNSNFNKDENNQNKKVLDKVKLTSDFVNLIDNIKQLNQTLNSLRKSGYFHIKNITFKIKNGKAFDENEQKDLLKIMEEYSEINYNFKKKLKEAYKNYPKFRLFYGTQFLELYIKAKEENKEEPEGNIKKNDISSIFNSVTMNNFINPDVDFIYDPNLDEFENINLYLNELFLKYKITNRELYSKNKVLPELKLKPGLYRKIKVGDNNDLIDYILNIYQNMTENIPILNTLLLCNEETSIDKIESFLYRALLCEEPILFIISNMECLDLSIIQELIDNLKSIYEYKNKNINSYVLFFYEKKDSGLVRDLEKIIPEKNILSNYYLKKPENVNKDLQKVDIYSSIYSGYGKTTEIKYKVKSKKGIYKYLPIGGSFSRDYVISNFTNLNINFQNAKKTYLHLDLSETDNDNLMIEILFKLIILRALDSNEKIYYLGNDINIIVEIPKGFVIFEEKYKLLNLFNKIHIKELCPLRFEEGVKNIGESPIAIVAEVLYFYDHGIIGEKNIDLNAPIKRSAKECEIIIDKYFNVENQSYYQKMNFIKILSVQFKKFTNNPYFDYSLYGNDPLIEKSRIFVIKNFIELTKVFTRSPFDGILLSQFESMKLFGKYNEERAIEEGIKKLADKNAKREIFSFEKKNQV